MNEYCVLYAILAALALYVRSKGEKADGKLIRNVNLICFVCVLILLMFRHKTMGRDLSGVAWIGYLNFFDRVAGQTVYYALFKALHFEFGFTLFVKLVSVLWQNHQFFIAVTAFVSLAPIAVLIGKKSRDPAFSWIIYTSLMPFFLLYSGLRQGIAIGIAAIAFILAEERKLLLFIITVLVAASFHTSAVLLFLIYPIMNLQVNVKWRAIAVAVLPLLILVCKVMIKLVIFQFPKYAYVLSENGRGSYRYFLMLLAVYFFCCVFTNNSRFQNAYLNLFYIACLFQMLGLFSETAPRAGFYFVLSLAVLLPDVIENIEKRGISVLSYFGAVVCFILLGFYCIYTTDWAMAYPYYWFWETVV